MPFFSPRAARLGSHFPSPGGKVPSDSEAEEECGWKFYGFCTVTDFLLCPTDRRSSSVFKSARAGRI